MRITSLGFRTDIMLLTLQGSAVEDRGDHLVVRSPGNPAFWWGNFVLLRDLPGRGGVQRWEKTFAQEFPEAAHRTFGVDGTRGEVADCGEFTAAGYAVDGSAVMTASSVHEPPHPNRHATCRALDLTDRGDRDAAIALQLANAPDREPSSHGEFLARKMEAMSALQEARCGSWFGAFVDGRMLSGMGLFSDGSGVARFQSVDTHPDARGRGLAGTLVHHVSCYGFADLGATTLVMVADPGYHAIDIYRSVGFETTETQIQLERSPRAAGES